jgi:hypothetical protein
LDSKNDIIHLMRIIDLTEADSGRIEQVAALLIDGFSDRMVPNNWLQRTAMGKVPRHERHITMRIGFRFR